MMTLFNVLPGETRQFLRQDDGLWPIPRPHPHFVRTLTNDGTLAFQHYFVRDRCQPIARGFEFAGAATVRLSPAIPFEDVRLVLVERGRTGAERGVAALQQA